MKNIIVIILLLLSVACKETILHDLSEHQANKALVVLSRAGIYSDKTANGLNWSIEVDSADSQIALSTLETARLFTDKSSSSASSSFGFIQSAEQRTYAIEESLSQRVEETLKQMPGVLDARVHLFRAKRQVFQAPDAIPSGTASVLMISESVAEVKESEIKILVAGALGLDVESVSVVLSQSQLPKDQEPAVVATDSEATENVAKAEVGPDQLGRDESADFRSFLLYLTATVLACIVTKMFFQYHRQEEIDLSDDFSEEAPTTISKLSAKEVF